MKTTLRQQHFDCLDRTIITYDGDRVSIVNEYHEDYPDIENLDELEPSAMVRCDYNKASFIEFLENTLAMLKVEVT